jgi:hypothetical protein
LLDLGDVDGGRVARNSATLGGHVACPGQLRAEYAAIAVVPIAVAVNADLIIVLTPSPD